MKKLKLNNMMLNEGNLLSNEEKRIITGGGGDPCAYKCICGGIYCFSLCYEASPPPENCYD